MTCIPFSVFFTKRRVLTVMHLFGIGVTESPILQTMRQRVGMQYLYISPFCQFLQIGISPYMLHFYADREFCLSAAKSCSYFSNINNLVFYTTRAIRCLVKEKRHSRLCVEHLIDRFTYSVPLFLTKILLNMTYRILVFVT